MGYRNNPALSLKLNEKNTDGVLFQDEIVSVDDILDSRIPDLPVETSFEVDWFVVDGKKINYIETCIKWWIPWYIDNKDKSQEDDKNYDIQLRSPSIHTLSFECELYLKNIKSSMFSNELFKKTEIYHQLQVDQGLKQILPYLINWIQTEVGMLINHHLLRFNPLWKRNQRICFPIWVILCISPTVWFWIPVWISFYMYDEWTELFMFSFTFFYPAFSLVVWVKYYVHSLMKTIGNWEPFHLLSLLRFTSDIRQSIQRCTNRFWSPCRKSFIILNQLYHLFMEWLNVTNQVCYLVGITHLGPNTIELMLLPIYKDIVSNLNNLLASTNSAVTQMQIHRCLFALSVWFGWGALGSRSLLVSAGRIFIKKWRWVII